MVKIYGHYFLIKGDKTTFHRHLIREFSFRDQDGKEKWTAYNFTRKTYDHFAPILLKIIKDAILHLPEPQSESIMSTTSAENESEVADSQELATSAPSSQGNANFKKPKLPPKAAMLQKEVDRQSQQIQDLMLLLKQNESTLNEQLAERDKRLAQENEENRQRHAELMEQLRESQQQLVQERHESQQRLIQEREESQQQLVQERHESQQRLIQEREESQQRHAELMGLLKQRNSLGE